MSESLNITKLLHDWRGGDRKAIEALMPLVYDELRRQASRYLRRERPNHTLQTTALIHETYIKLTDNRNLQVNDRAHFFALSANLMRRILVDHARTRKVQKRGGNAETLQLEHVDVAIAKTPNIDLIELDEALARLEKHDRQQAQIVELRYFSGLTLEETAEALEISRTTVATDWAMAKAWLFRELSK